MKDLELQKYYDDQLTLFASEGWKDFIVKVEELYKGYNNISAVNNEKDLFIVKGRLDILNWVLEWENLVKEAIEQNEVSL